MKTQEEIDRCYEISKVILQQIIAGVGKAVYWSWGVSKQCYSFYNDIPTLCLRVSGAIHKGWVYISYNEGNDAYDVTLLNVSKQVKLQRECVYCDELGEVIDSLVERPEGISDDQYKAISSADSMVKINRFNSQCM